ncbi:TlpA family protein disulfide reductase [Chitinophaga arvensicola]|uniref:Thiol-disulfide isomerase or thioredoxin n=1 Tax=Chitinophaga arvensicola TaxID=29529 RepID=A0A1I0RDG2_9BACT|nr:TlpA disulfide reductase family protein [Chitinophaga arvensicola]SEW38912.1 Thiol-disulfide isomerase or thioredoxin [Chitinophaga arvensicola]
MKPFTILLLLLALAFSKGQAQQRVVITPAYPQRGETVTVTYDPSAPGAGIPAAANAVTMVFSYSNFYNQPWRMNMHREGDKWKASFVLADYTVYATFYLESGEAIDQPAKDQHYEIPVYTNKIPVKDASLYKAYSLSAQMGKSPLLADKQAALYKKELARYPDNYEAKLRLLTYEINKAGTVKEKEKLRGAAHQVIADRFNSAPTNSGNMNKVTMGYLIIGENTRLDSIRRVVMERYPHSELGRDLLTGVRAKGKDTADQIVFFEKELLDETPANSGSFTEMHDILFQYYAAKKDSAKALYHARFLTTGKENPYQAPTWQSIAQTLLDNSLSLDSARGYAQRALDSVRTYPVGVIRFFPETGYIYPYADDSTRNAVYNKASRHLSSILGLIAMKQSQLMAADKHMAQAVDAYADKETLDNAAQYYQATNNTAKLTALQTFRKKLLEDKVRKQRINKPAPPLTSFVDMKGTPVTAASLKGKIVVIDFWATWCIPCMQEMPYLQRLYDQYKQHPDVVFMIINSGAKNTLADAQGWSGHKKYTFPVYYNTDPAIGDKFRFNIIPASYLIDKAGNIQFVNIGFEGPEVEEKLKQQLELLLKD